MSAALLHRIFLRMGLGDWNASVATLSIVLSPLFLPLATTFMSDVPGMIAVLVCLYCCVQSHSDAVREGYDCMASSCGTLQ